jgi:hypothetical protein
MVSCSPALMFLHHHNSEAVQEDVDVVRRKGTFMTVCRSRKICVKKGTEFAFNAKLQLVCSTSLMEF